MKGNEWLFVATVGYFVGGGDFKNWTALIVDVVHDFPKIRTDYVNDLLQVGVESNFQLIEIKYVNSSNQTVVSDGILNIWNERHINDFLKIRKN